MIASEKYSCVGAKAALKRASYRFGAYSQMYEEGVTAGLCYDLYNFLADQTNGANGITGPFTAFIACFSDRKIESEMDFHTRMWKQLQAIHDLDWQYHPWDSRVSSDIGSPYFAFSFARRALFVVGLNPYSSRIARRFPWPAIVFNPHSQFRLMRQQNTFEAMKSAIRERELALQGSLNPNLADHGTDSEAKQYSGAAANADLICPFHAKHR
jgi:FPC/CPF motif-containing protein YcgG